jgi:hypothetical protein
MNEFLKPAKLELYESLQVSGPSSVARLAERLDRPADSLYYHLRTLVRIGVVEQVADATSGSGRPGRNGSVYRVTPGELVVSLDPSSKASREAWIRGSAAVLRLAQRDAIAAIAAGTAETDGPNRTLLARRVKVRLTRRQLKDVNRHLDALQELLCDHREAPRGERYAVTVSLSPLPAP